MKKKLIALSMVAVVTLGVLTGCASSPPQPKPQTMSENLKESSQKVAQNQSSLEKNQPAPSISFSNERANLIKRATTFNDPNKLSYIYLFTKAGTIAGFYTVKGKVSSISSYLVPDEQIVKDPYYSSSGIVVQAPDIDGSYGTNGGGVFFYTADNVYVEWNGEYMLVDQPLKVSQSAVLVQQNK